METINLICINCPMGCPLEVKVENGEVISVTGNTCPRGAAYGKKEVTSPTRIVTSTVRVKDSKTGAVTVPCKTSSDIPKSKIFDIIKDISDVTVSAPVAIGDVVKENVADTGVNMIATKNII